MSANNNKINVRVEITVSNDGYGTDSVSNTYEANHVLDAQMMRYSTDVSKPVLDFIKNEFALQLDGLVDSHLSKTGWTGKSGER